MKSRTKQEGLLVSSIANSIACRQQLLSYSYMPHLEYAVQAWDPFLSKNIQKLELVQKFALKMCCKSWNSTYSEILQQSSLPTLSFRRKYLCLSYNLMLILILSLILTFFNSYFPKTISVYTCAVYTCARTLYGLRNTIDDHVMVCIT